MFVHDLVTAVTQRVSLTPSGSQFTDLSGRPSLSDDGDLVAFQGRDGDTDAIYVRQRGLALTQSISATAGLDGQCVEPAISGDGRWVAFVRITGESQHVYVVDRTDLSYELVSRSSSGVAGDEPSRAPSISRDGRWIAFASTADNLVANDTNEKDDVFVHDRQTGVTRRVSLSSGGAQGNDDSGEAGIAADGRFVVFSSKAENLVAGDDNGKVDVFVHDMLTGLTERVSVNPQGGEVDAESWMPRIGADGRYVVFSSLSDDLVAGDSNGKEDVFRRDLDLAATIRVSRAQGGGDPDELSTGPALAADAPVVAYTSKAGNLVPDDDNDKEDVFTAPRD
ncbi:MAG: PD40 domain-containing protein [Planctomycetes bacterium]|nr:PD40 domain-containing protein [Planctomycetota bacterium]